VYFHSLAPADLLSADTGIEVDDLTDAEETDAYLDADIAPPN
jgi:hypothetical protein